MLSNFILVILFSSSTLGIPQEGQLVIPEAGDVGGKAKAIASRPLQAARRPLQAAIEFICPEPTGTYEDPEQCDKYWSCHNGRAVAKYCDDGHVFDKFKDPNRDPCDTPFIVDCGTKTKLQEPSYHSEFCPRRNGLYAHPDPTVCNIFFTCVKGKHVKKVCTTGLHFDIDSATCVWPGTAKRIGCAPAKRASVNGFSCPFGDVFNHLGVKLPHPSFPNLVDCQKFYVCLNGETPQEASCNLGQVFKESSRMCEFPENVPECKDWYIDHPDFAHYYYDTDPNAASAKSDPGAQDAVV